MSDVFYEPEINSVEDILRLPAKGKAIVWQVDSLARRFFGHLPAADLAAIIELGCWIEDDWICWYRPGRSLSAMRLLGGKITVEGTRRTVTSPAGLFPGKTRRQAAGDRETLPVTLGEIREACIAAKVPLPNQWCGPGDFAAAALKHWRVEPFADPPSELFDIAMTYYGGRIEVTAHGDVPGPLYEYDLNSAYGAAMLQLPAPGGVWREGEGLYTLIQCKWHMPRKKWCRLGPLPVRKPTGTIHYPQAGRGVYWAHELTVAQTFGAKVEIEKAWSYRPPIGRNAIGVYDRVWQMVDALHAARMTVGTFAKPILPACYGKFIQHRGKPKWPSLAAAGYVTSLVRTWILETCMSNPDGVMMIATDSVWSQTPIDLCLGAYPGQWKVKTHEDIHIVSPGFYWEKRREGTLKTAGWRANDIRPRQQELERLWRNREIGARAPELIVPVTVNGTIPLAVMFNDPKMLAAKTEIEMRLSYNWNGKRAERLDQDGPLWRSRPKTTGHINAAYKPDDGPDITKMMEAEL